MSHAPREWPNNAKEARDRSAEKLVENIRLLHSVVREFKQMPDIDKLQRISLALDNSQTAVRFLEEAGACTRPG